jgi:flagellar hook protein FlgE
MSFASSLSGLNAASKAIDVIGNNIANSQTIGFKSSKASFADVLAASAAGEPSSGAASAGVSVDIINQRFDQGVTQQSDNSLDMAIIGPGFFRLSDGGAISYTRDGQFQLSYESGTLTQRVLVNRAGLNVTGYAADYSTDPRGVIVRSATPQNILIDPVMPAVATSMVSVGASLDAQVAPPAVAPFAANNALTFNNSTALTVYDSTGASHELRMYFSKSSPGNLWNIHATLDGASQTGPVSLSFDTNGLLTSTMPLAAQTYALGGGGSVSFTLDLSGTVQYGNPFSVSSMTQNGYAEGTIIDGSLGLRVGNDGVIHATYSNGQSRKVAQVVLANFVNPNALINQGDNRWLANADPVQGTGVELLDTPGGSLGFGLGSIQGAAREQSNVDLTTELVALIEQQRNYQASAQTFKILDQVLQNLSNAT